MAHNPFRDVLRRPGEIDLARAVLAFAEVIAYPDLDAAHYLARLDDLAEQVAAAAPRSSPDARLDALVTHLFTDLGFSGNAAHYADPANSYLNAVLDRRLGLPISLSVLFIEVGRRIGLEVHGIGLPGHFITGVDLGEETVWVDPFYGGRMLSLDDCRELIRLSTGYEGPLEAAWFQPSPHRTILGRMLTNLRVTYISRQDWPRAIATVEQLRLVQLDVAEHSRDLGLLYYRIGDLARSAHFLNTYLEQAPEANDAPMIRNGVAGLLDEWVRKN